MIRKHYNAFTVHLKAPDKDDVRVIRSLPSQVVSKHKAKHHRKEARVLRERATWQAGFKGEIPVTGKEQGPDYVDRLRVTDGSRTVSQKAWLRRGVK